MIENINEDWYKVLMGLPQRNPINDFEFQELYKTRPNELHPELLNIISIATSPEQSSNARMQMFGGSHINQTLTTAGATKSNIFQGPEYRLSEYCFNIKMPHDGQIVKTLHRIPGSGMGKVIRESPETTILYEYEKEIKSPDGIPTGRLMNELDVLSLKTHFEAHPRFGFKYNRVMKSLPPAIRKGTMLAQSPSIAADGFWQYAIQTTVANLSIAGVIEDGLVVSEEWCDEAASTCVETYRIAFGKTHFPLDMNPDKESDEYMVIPNVGECVGPDGILAALREYNDRLAPALMSRRATRIIDHKYDRLTRVTPGAKVIDVKVYHDTRYDGGVRGKFPRTPDGMDGQLRNYYELQLNYYREIIKLYEEKQKSSYYRGNVHITPRLSRLIYEAYGFVGVDGDANNYIRTFRNSNIDEWVVDVTIEYQYVPGVSSKLTGKHGNKGVIVKKVPRAEMPVDEWGNRVDIIDAGLATVRRMILSAPQEAFINASARDTMCRLRMMQANGTSYEELSTYMLNFYKIVSVTHAEDIVDDNGLVRRSYFDAIVNDLTLTMLPIHMPTNNSQEPLNVLYNLCIYYRPRMSPVTYKGASGKMVTTKKPALVGSAYVMVLEKAGDAWTGVASCKLNNFGVPAKITSSDRYTSPAREMGIRFGEGEARLMVATCGPRQTADLYNATNSPLVRKHIQERIYASKTPTAIDNISEQTENTRGTGRIHSLVRHLGRCDGWSFSRLAFNMEEDDE